MREIVARVGDDGQRVRRQDAVEAERELGAADAARQCEHRTGFATHRNTFSLSAPGGGEGRGEVGDSKAFANRPTSPSHCCAMGPSLSDLKRGEGYRWRHP